MKKKAKQGEKPKIALISMPATGATAALDSILAILKDIAERVVLLARTPHQYTAENVEVIGVRVAESHDVAGKLISQVVTDFTLAFNLVKVRHKVDMVFFHLVPKCPLSVLVARLLGKRVAVGAYNVVKILSNTLPKIPDYEVPSWVHFKAMEILETLCFHFCHRIWVEANSVVTFGGLEKYRNKISTFFVFTRDVNKFALVNPPEERDNVVACVGRLEVSKGILELLKAIPIVLNMREDVKFIIIGDGLLKAEVADFADSPAALGRVGYVGPVPNDDLPHYLNQVKLLVLPSYSEGVPGRLFEAMACGAVPVVTPVGGIPDIVTDGKSGFVIHDNSPESIAAGILKALGHSELNSIAREARRFIEQEYSHQALIEKASKAISELADSSCLNKGKLVEI